MLHSKPASHYLASTGSCGTSYPHASNAASVGERCHGNKAFALTPPIRRLDSSFVTGAGWRTARSSKMSQKFGSARLRSKFPLHYRAARFERARPRLSPLRQRGSDCGKCMPPVATHLPLPEPTLPDRSMDLQSENASKRRNRASSARSRADPEIKTGVSESRKVRNGSSRLRDNGLSNTSWQMSVATLHPAP